MMYYLGGDVVWRNSDLTGIAVYNTSPTSTNWTKMTNTTVTGANITALDVSKTPANILYFGTNNSQIYKVNNANNGDPAKQNISASNFPADANIGCVKVNPPKMGMKSFIFIPPIYKGYSGILGHYKQMGGIYHWESLVRRKTLEGNSRLELGQTGPILSWGRICFQKGNGKKYFLQVQVRDYIQHQHWKAITLYGHRKAPI